jgi:hypothetical protein
MPMSLPPSPESVTISFDVDIAQPHRSRSNITTTCTGAVADLPVGMRAICR